MNKKTFIIGLGYGKTNRFTYLIEQGNNKNTPKNSFIIEGRDDWATIKDKIENVYDNSNNESLDIYRDEGTLNLFQHIGNIKQEWPNSTIILVFDKDFWLTKKDDKRSKEILPTIDNLYDEVLQYISDNNLTEMHLSNNIIESINSDGSLNLLDEPNLELTDKVQKYYII